MPTATVPAAGPGGAHRSAAARTRRLVALLALFFGAATGVSLLYDVRGTAERYEQVALAAARVIFQQAVLTRRWNAEHGGIYVPVSERTPSNPFLEDSARDVVTTSGLRLTKLNPAYMTREISEQFRDARGIQLHITSLRPIRPQNAPDPWEQTALAAFEQGARERYEVKGAGHDAMFRYMAPLLTEAACLECHAKQGYRVGDVRGGISVTLPFAPYRTNLVRAYRSSVVAHLVFLSLGLGLVAVLGRSLLARVGDLQASLDHIRHLEGLLPICASCKKIRSGGAASDQESWEPIENYLSRRTDATFTHGLCPECARQYFGNHAR